MKMISQFFVLTLLVSLTACAANKKQMAAQSASTDAKVVAAVAESDIKTPEKPVVVAPKPTIYIVKPNETLERIAKAPAVYGDRRMWPVLFEANRDKLSHPSKIYPGQRLRIPRDTEEIAVLKKRAGTNKVILTADQAYREAQAAKQRALAAKTTAVVAPSIASVPPTPAPVLPPSIPEAPKAVEIISPTVSPIPPSAFVNPPTAEEDELEEYEEEDIEEEASPL